MPNPSLSVKAAAELLQLPAYEQERILLEQKYPRQQPQSFRAPFYSPALAGIRRYYAAGRDPLVLATQKAAIRQLGLPQRRDHNLRVISEFEGSPQAQRQIQPLPSPRIRAAMGTVEFRLSLDLLGDERGQLRRIYYNCRSTPIEVAVAKTALDIASWVLEEAGFAIPMRQLEYVDFAGGRVVKHAVRSAQTIRRLRASARIIEAIWPSL